MGRRLINKRKKEHQTLLFRLVSLEEGQNNEFTQPHALKVGSQMINEIGEDEITTGNSCNAGYNSIEAEETALQHYNRWDLRKNNAMYSLFECP